MCVVALLKVCGTNIQSEYRVEFGGTGPNKACLSDPLLLHRQSLVRLPDREHSGRSNAGNLP